MLNPMNQNQNLPIRRKAIGPGKWTHGASHIPEFVNYNSMLARCYRASSPDYHRYGGRGIRVCEFLRTTPINLVLLLGYKPSPVHTVDRIDREKHYSCGKCSECHRLGLSMNVRWATKSEQMRNTSRNVWLTFNGKTKCLKDWAQEIGISESTLRKRIKNGRELLAPRNSAYVRFPKIQPHRQACI